MKKGMGNPTSPEFHKVFERGHRFDFSPSIINQYLSCPDPEGPSATVFVLTKGKYSSWPKNNNLHFSILSTRYSILHKIGVYNWLPITHKFTITKSLPSLLYLIGTKQSFNLGRLMFDHVLRHIESKAQKLGICYSSIFLGFLLLIRLLSPMLISTVVLHPKFVCSISFLGVNTSLTSPPARELLRLTLLQMILALLLLVSVPMLLHHLALLPLFFILNS